MTRRVLLATLLAVATTFAAKPAAPTPLATLQANDKILQEMLRRIPKEELPGNDSLRKHLSTMFDFGELGKRALGKSWNGKPKADQDSFLTYFARMVEKTALQNPQDYLSDSSSSVVVGKPTKTEAVVRSTVHRGTSKVEILYSLALGKSGWRVYDLKVGEKPSQVDKYRNQFAQYLKKKTFQDLVASVRKNASN